MADGDNKQESGTKEAPAAAPANSANLEKQITELTTNLETANGLVKSLQAEKAEIEKSVGGYNSANTQLNSQLASLQNDLEAARKEAADSAGSVINLQQQVDGLSGQVGTLNEAKSELEKQTKLFNVIVENQELHPYVSQFNELAKIVSPDAEPDAIKDVFTKIAQVNTSQIENLTEGAVKGFQVGGTPPAPTGPASPGSPAGTGNETTVEGVFAKLQGVDTLRNPGEYNRLMNVMYNLQNPAAPAGTQPN